MIMKFVLLIIYISFVLDLQPPQYIEVQNIKQDSAYVSWLPPEEDYNCVEGYILRWQNQSHDLSLELYDKDDNEALIGNVLGLDAVKLLVAVLLQPQAF